MSKKRYTPEEIIGKLRRTNITARALVPGVNGLGRSVAELVKLGAAYESDGGEKEEEDNE